MRMGAAKLRNGKTAQVSKTARPGAPGFIFPSESAAWEEVLTLAERSRKIFVETLLNPQKPNDAAIAAARRIRPS
jgi:hypothetical protein